MPIKNYLPAVVLIFVLLSCSKDQASNNALKQQTLPDEPAPAEEIVPVSSPVANTFTDQYGNLIYTKVDQKPTFEGGESALYDFLSQQLHYPKEAEARRAEGTVLVAFVINKDGTIRNVELANGVAESSLNVEAMRVVSAMPNWIPGIQNGEKVNVKYTLPVKFQLQ